MESKIYKIYKIHITAKHEIKEQFVAKYMILDGNFVILEDHANVFHDLKSGPLNAEIDKALHRISNDRHYKVADIFSNSELLRSLPVTQMEELENIHKESAKTTPIVFKYKTKDASQELSFIDQKFFLDNQLLTTEEVKTILENVKAGYAVLEQTNV